MNDPSSPTDAPAADTSPLPDRSRCLSCAGLIVLALIGALHFAAPLLLPIVLAVLFNLLLSPAVRALERLGVPLPLSCAFALEEARAAAGQTVDRVQSTRPCVRARRGGLWVGDSCQRCVRYSPGGVSRFPPQP